MKKKLLLLLTTIVFLFAVSCSSAPRKSSEVNTRKNRAADFMGFGNRYFAHGIYSQALVFFYMALDENIAADFDYGKSRVKGSIGRTHLLMGNLSDAERYLLESYNLAKQLGDRALLASAASKLAELYVFGNLLSEAEKFASEAIALARTNSNTMAEALHILAMIERRKGMSEKALTTIDRAIRINRRNRAHINLAANYYLMASIFSQQGNFNKATEMLHIAIREDRLIENSYGIAQSYKALGIVALRNNQREEAYPFFIRALNIFRVIENVHEERSVLEFLIEISADLGSSNLDNFRARLRALEQ
ncbi:MAG: tetratricopeptide repeat protein [Spirochaetes bacterium]|nr:tetratricopeptide repeat protein [Spirochaetota bacterium]